MTGAQIENQINANYDSMIQLNGQIRQATLPPWQKAQIEQRLRTIWQSQQYWAKEYFKTTGKSMVLHQEVVIVESAADALQSAAQTRAQRDSRQKAQDAIGQVKFDYNRIQLLLQDQYDISVQWKNMLFSHWVRMGAGLNAQHPLFIKKRVEDTVLPLLREAERLIAANQFGKAWEKIGLAARWVKWGFDQLNWWMNRLEVGAERAVAAIKVSAALATIIVSAPVEVGIFGAMGLAALAEGSQQGTTLLLKGLGPGETVSLDDLKNAALATAISAASAGLGKGFGKLLAKGLAGAAAQRLLGKAPSKEAIEFLAARIENYVAANTQAILNKLLKLDNDPDWNWWYMAVTPAINGAAMEMVKEPTLNKLLKR